ncbi:MAG: MerR family transcriptional regulator [Dehalococcoidia bacterium]|nr:MerR family transcriptional regulator [Dehalococcoidia bacterium]
MEYTVHAAGRATGISPWRIRTWERRYGVPAPRRDAGGRRTYTEADLVVLRRMAALVDQGLSASHAADAIRNEEDTTAAEAAPPALDPRVDVLIDAAAEFDESTCVEVLRLAAETSWATSLEAVVMPALRQVGLRWERGEASIGVEHFLSLVIQRELLTAIASLPPAEADAPCVLVACAQDDFHDLGATALWLLLRERGAQVICLGADVPARALVLATLAVRPAVVCLSGVAATSTPMLAEAARALVEARCDARVFVGGPAASGAASEGIPASRLPDPLPAAADALLAAARGHGH